MQKLHREKGTQIPDYISCRPPRPSHRLLFIQSFYNVMKSSDAEKSVQKSLVKQYIPFAKKGLYNIVSKLLFCRQRRENINILNHFIAYPKRPSKKCISNDVKGVWRDFKKALLRKPRAEMSIVIGLLLCLRLMVCVPISS